MSQVDEIWHKHRCSGKFNVHLLRILLKVISMEIISIYVILTSFWVRDKLIAPT